MFYLFLKSLSRLTALIYFRKVAKLNKKHWELHGPLIIACNHSNSFLDAVIIATYSKNPVHFIVRGDVFKKPIIRKMFEAINMIPIYRISEGRDNVKKNDLTFEKCKNVLNSNGIILIFSEGICVQEWNLRPLGKGTARIVHQYLLESKSTQNLKILPLGLNYDRFAGPGTTVFGDSQDPIDPSQIPYLEHEGAWLNNFNQILRINMEKVVWSEKKVKDNVSPTPIVFKILKSVVKVIHSPFYLPLKQKIKQKAGHTVFYDSILYGALMFLYPLYIILLIGLLYIINPLLWYIPLFFPLMAYLSLRRG